jgi:hypothetical protein
LDLWLDKASTIKDGYQYESEFIKTARNVNQILLSQSLGEVSGNRNKKKLHTCFGKFEVNKNHVLSMHTEEFSISSKLQEILCLLAQDCVFEEASELLHQLLGIDICAKQIQRLSEHYGGQLEESEKFFADGTVDVPMVVSGQEDSAPVYVMVDGSMICMREGKWKEIKVGRIYSEKSRVAMQENRTEVLDSIYACSLGNNREFFRKFDPYVDPYGHKVFIADGAKWIWNWVESYYGDSVQIVDFFHAVEKLGAYATLACKDIGERKQWLEKQKQRLKDDRVEEVVAELENATARTAEEGKLLKDAIRYYQNNIERMKYGTFIGKGYLIGSGAIESAHRNVIQKRLKLSGQRWSTEGAQKIANLRAYKKSNRWEAVINQIKNVA